jgi:hypothetical protein
VKKAGRKDDKEREMERGTEEERLTKRKKKEYFAKNSCHN